MIHIKAIGLGIVVLAVISGAAVLLGNYPAVGFFLLFVACAYCFGRMVLTMLPTKRT